MISSKSVYGRFMKSPGRTAFREISLMAVLKAKSFGRMPVWLHLFEMVKVGGRAGGVFRGKMIRVCLCWKGNWGAFGEKDRGQGLLFFVPWMGIAGGPPCRWYTDSGPENHIDGF